MRLLICSFLSFLFSCSFVFSYYSASVFNPPEKLYELEIQHIGKLSDYLIISLNKKNKSEWDKFLDIYKVKDAVNALLKEDLKQLPSLGNCKLNFKKSFNKYFENKKKICDDSEGKFNFSENTVIELKVPGWWYMLIFFLVIIFPSLLIISSFKNTIILIRKNIRKYYPNFIGYLIVIIPFFSSCNYVNNSSKIFDKYLCEYEIKIKDDNKRIAEAFSNTIQLPDLNSAFDNDKTCNLINHLFYKFLSDKSKSLEDECAANEEKYNKLISDFDEKKSSLFFRLYVSLCLFGVFDLFLLIFYLLTAYFKKLNYNQCPRCFERKLESNPKDKSTMICSSNVCNAIKDANEANSISIISVGDTYKNKIAFPLLGPVRSGKSQYLFSLYRDLKDLGISPGRVAINIHNAMNPHFSKIVKDMVASNQSLNNLTGPTSTNNKIYSSLIFNFSDSYKSNFICKYFTSSDSYANVVDCSGELFASVSTEKIEFNSMRKAAVRSNNLCVFIDPSYFFKEPRENAIGAWGKHTDIYNKFRNTFYKLNNNQTTAKPLNIPVAICVTKLDLFMQEKNKNVPEFKNVRNLISKLYSLPCNFSFSTINKSSKLTKDILSDIFRDVDIVNSLDRIFGKNLMFFPVFNSPNINDQAFTNNRRVIHPFLWMLHANGFQSLEE